MNLVLFVAGIMLTISVIAAVIVIQDEQRIRSEAEIRRCTMTDCYFNDDLGCRSLTDTWNPELLDNCPDYTED